MFEALINGADSGVRLIIGIAALLIAILGIVALLDMITGGLGGHINHFIGVNIDWSLKGLLGYLFYPLTIVIDVPYTDAYAISKIIGGRTPGGGRY